MFITGIFCDIQKCEAQTQSKLGEASKFGVLSGSSIMTNANSEIKGWVGAKISVDEKVNSIDPILVLSSSPCLLLPALDEFIEARKNMHLQEGLPIGKNIKNITFQKGVYEVLQPAQMSELIILQGNELDEFVFNFKQNLVIKPDTKIELIGGVKPENVYFNVETQLIIGNNADIQGNFLAGGSITAINQAKAEETRLFSEGNIKLGGLPIAGLTAIKGINPMPKATITADGPLAFCDGGSVTLTANSGAKYWNWSIGETSQNIIVTEGGSYTVTVTFQNNCEGSDSIKVIVYSLPVAYGGKDRSIDIGEYTQLGSTPISGNAYQWSPIIGLSNSIISNPVAVPESTIEYILTVTDNHGCTATDDVIVNVNENPAILTPDGIFDNVFDQYGNKYKLSEIIVAKEQEQVTATYEKSLLLCTAGYFNVYCEEGSGMEGNSSIEIERREVICQMLQDISDFIISPLTSNGLGNKINIWVRDIANLPNIGDPASSGILGLATSFYCVPGGASTTNGIADNTIWETINSGIDAYTNIAVPIVSQTGQAPLSSGNFYHGLMAFNFSNPDIDWHTLVSTPNISTSSFDLYTVALHEMIHALGFGSLISGDGLSKMGPNFNYYSRYDMFLKDRINNFLISNTSNCQLYNYTFTSDVNFLISPDIPINCTDQCKYSGSIIQPVCTPGVFYPASSLSHFEDQCHANLYPDNSYFVMSDVYDPSVTLMKRYLQPEEKSVLCDLGYTVTSSFGSVANNNYYDYGMAGFCSGFQVAGINDGFNSDGTFVWIASVGVDLNLTGADILGNDYHATEFECLQDIYGLGTVSVTSGNNSTNISYTPNQQGTALLRYVPVDGSNKGNITYVYIRINSSDCGTDACNMIPNASFEQTTLTCESGAYNSINCWTNYTASPDLFGRGCTNPDYDIPDISTTPPTDTYDADISNEHFVGLWGGYTDPNYLDEESMQVVLLAPIESGVSYTLKFYAKVSNASNFVNIPANIAVTASANTLPVPSPPDNAHYNIDNPNLTILIEKIEIPANGDWNFIEREFTYTGANSLKNLIIGYDASVVSVVGKRYVMMDDLKIEPSVSDLIVSPLPDLTCNETIDDLSLYVDPSTGTFSGPGVSCSGGICSFDASSAGLSGGTYSIEYTYINNIGCEKTASLSVVTSENQWLASDYSSLERNSCSGMASNNSGDIFLTGYLCGPTHFGDIVLTSPSSNPMLFLAKYNGCSYEWAIAYGDLSPLYQATVVTDDAGNLYVAGTSLDNGQPPLPPFGLISGGFLAKIDSKFGTLIWAKSIGADTHVNNITMDPSSGDIYVVGGNGYNSSSDMFIARYDAAGNEIWADSYGSADRDEYTGVAVDASGNVFVSGWISGGVPPFGTNSTLFQGIQDAFVGKYSNTGQRLFGDFIGGTGSDMASDVDVDDAGSFYVTGVFQEAVDMNPQNLQYLVTSLNNSPDVFTASYSTANGYLNWVQTSGSDDPLHPDIGRALAYYGGNVCVTGSVGCCSTFGTIYSSTGSEVSSNLSSGAQMASWATPADIMVNSTNGLAYISGAFYHEIDFGNVTYTTPGTSTNMFVIRMSSADGFFKSQPGFSEENIDGKNVEQCIECNELTVYPNPGTGLFTVLLPPEGQNGITITVRNVLGEQIRRIDIEEGSFTSITIDLSGVPNGIYFFSFQTVNETMDKKIILMR